MARPGGIPPSVGPARNPAQHPLAAARGHKPLLSAMATTQIESDLALSWTIRTSVASSVAPSWRINAAVETDRALGWRIAQPVNASLALSWQIVAPVASGGWARLPFESRLIPLQPQRKQVAAALSLAWSIHRNVIDWDALAVALVIADGDPVLAMALNEALGGATQ